MQQRNVFSFNKKIDFDFKGGKLTGESGLLLFHEYNERLGIKELLERYYKENRKGRFFHKKSEILYQEILRMVAGYPSANTVKYQKHDPTYQKIHNGKQASAATISRWGKVLQAEDGINIRGIQSKIVEDFYQQNEPEKITIDLDTTYDPASKNLEEANFNTHYQTTGFAPLVAFDGESGIPLQAELRPGNWYCCKNAVSFLEKTIQNLPRQITAYFLRGDSGFASPEIYEFCENQNLTYTIKMKRTGNVLGEAEIYFNEKVKPKITANLESKTEKTEKTENIFYHSYQYQAQSWEKQRRIVVKIIMDPEKLFPTYQVIVTNDQEKNPKEVFDFYNQRAVCENFIEEGKNGFSWDHLSHKKFTANQARFQIFFLAMTIFKLFQVQTIEESWQKKSVQTIRLELFRVAAKLVKNARRFKFRMASSFYNQRVFLKIFQNIQNISWRFG